MKRISSNDIQSYSDIRGHKRAIRKEMRAAKSRIQHKLEHYAAEWAVTKSVSKGIYTVFTLLGSKRSFLKRLIAYGSTIASKKAINNWFDEKQQEDLKQTFQQKTERAKHKTMEAIYNGSEPVLNFLHKVFDKKKKQ